MHVVAGVIRDRRGRVLLSLRPRHLEQGGLWEFPGGKLERGERPIDGLARELFEELGIRIRGGVPLIQLFHEYPEKIVFLNVWEIDRWQHEVQARESQDIRWVDPLELGQYQFPEANEAVVAACGLPRLQLITPTPDGDADRFIDRLAVCLAAGVSVVQLRAKTCSCAEYRALAARVLETCRAFNTRLILNADAAEVQRLQADGVHLPSTRLLELRRRPLDAPYMVSASCHDARELEQAERLNVDFVFLSPVQNTISHPGAIPLGWNELRRLVKHTSRPVYALGGMEIEDLTTAVAAGCQGIALIRGIWFSDRPEQTAPRVYAALRRARKTIRA